MGPLLRRVRWGNVGRLTALLAAGVLIASGGRGCGEGAGPGEPRTRSPRQGVGEAPAGPPPRGEPRAGGGGGSGRGHGRRRTAAERGAAVREGVAGSRRRLGSER